MTNPTTPRRIAACILLAYAAVACAVVACSSSSAPAAGPAVEHRPVRALNVNSNFEVGSTLAELPIFELSYAGDSDAAATQSEQVVRVTGPGTRPIAISACFVAPLSNLTASNTAYATIDIWKRVGDGGNPQTLLASASTVITQSDAGSDGGATGNWTAFTNQPLFLNGSAYVSPGDEVTFAVAKTGAGVLLPQMRIACFSAPN